MYLPILLFDTRVVLAVLCRSPKGTNIYVIKALESEIQSSQPENIIYFPHQSIIPPIIHAHRLRPDFPKNPRYVGIKWRASEHQALAKKPTLEIRLTHNANLWLVPPNAPWSFTLMTPRQAMLIHCKLQLRRNLWQCPLDQIFSGHFCKGLPSVAWTLILKAHSWIQQDQFLKVDV